MRPWQQLTVDDEEAVDLLRLNFELFDFFFFLPSSSSSSPSSPPPSSPSEELCFLGFAFLLVEEEEEEEVDLPCLPALLLASPSLGTFLSPPSLSSWFDRLDLRYFSLFFLLQGQSTYSVKCTYVRTYLHAYNRCVNFT